MATEEEVIKMGKKLEKMISENTTDHATAKDLLLALKNMKMTLNVLQKTRIGMTVNSFRKSSSNDDVITLAKTLIKSWKKLLPGDSPSSKKTESNEVKEEKLKERTSSPVEEKDSNDSGSNSGKSTPPPQQSTSSKTVPDTTDGIRIKCRELIMSALTFDEMPEGCEDPEDLAAEIEDIIYTEFCSTNSKYKTRVRSRVSNLRDKKNPDLRHNVLTGKISAGVFAKMTSEEMASEDMKTLRKKLTKESIDDHQMAQTSGTHTDLLKCGKCGKRNCSYNQVQTRSADEPMTTFVLCNNCGNRWKFC